MTKLPSMLPRNFSSEGGGYRTAGVGSEWQQPTVQPPWAEGGPGPSGDDEPVLR